MHRERQRGVQLAASAGPVSEQFQVSQRPEFDRMDFDKSLIAERVYAIQRELLDAFDCTKPSWGGELKGVPWQDPANRVRKSSERTWEPRPDMITGRMKKGAEFLSKA